MNYVEKVRNEVYGRMIAERRRAAELYRSEGYGKRAEIDGQREKELKKITSQAYRTAQGIKGNYMESCIYNKDWGFKLEDIGSSILLWHGDSDEQVPISVGKYVAEKSLGSNSDRQRERCDNRKRGSY